MTILMREYPLHYAHTNEYKRVLGIYLKSLEQMRTFKVNDTNERTAMPKMEELRQEFKEAYNNYIEQVRADLADKMNRIEKQYKNTRNNYSDPQAEILRRQDFDLEISILDKDEILHRLSDNGRDFSRYELAKIKSLFPNSTSIATALASRSQDASEEAYSKNLAYRQAQQEATVLQMIAPNGVSMTYTPVTDDDGNVGYEMYDLDLNGKDFHISDLDHRISQMKEIIGNIRPSISTGDIELVEQAERRKERRAKKKRKYEDFHPTIFRGTPEYSVIDRFKYLEERFNDTTTDFWDPMRDDYDPVEHSNFLEARHEDYMQKNPRYAELYRKAEYNAKAVKSNNEESESFGIE